jgi:hydrogenase nickel incorporation protein HypA/HybF
VRMHELSIVLSIIDGVTEEAELRGARGVSAVHLRLGALSGVMKPALLFAYDLACEGTLLQGSQLIVEESPMVVHCSTCDADRAVESPQSFHCPVCGADAANISRDQEIRVVAMELV